MGLGEEKRETGTFVSKGMAAADRDRDRARNTPPDTLVQHPKGTLREVASDSRSTKATVSKVEESGHEDTSEWRGPERGPASGR